MTRSFLPLSIIASIGFSSSAFAVQYMTVEEAQRAMFSEATAFKESSVRLSPEQMIEVQKLAGLPARSASWRVFTAYKGSTLLGYVVIDDVLGKYELISYAVALNLDASVKQIEILNYRESHGLEIKNSAWRKQFVGKTVQNGIRPGDDIANISGATLSCAHVTDGVRRVAAVMQVSQKKI